ncbi:MAG: PAS domain-containing protein [Candidatus Omnitrophica bacterium]|nr:PAS domain-containing protein [Candidatus Omnitrophota bacterium]
MKHRWQMNLDETRTKQLDLLAAWNQCGGTCKTQKFHLGNLLATFHTIAQQIIRTLPQALLVFDQTGVVHLANPAAARLFKLPEEELIGRAIWAVGTGLVPRENIEALIWTGNAQRYERTYLTREGTAATLEVSLSVLQDQSGRPIGVVWMAQELADRQHHEEESFSLAASHDLNAPLRRIEGLSQALWEECGDRLGKEGQDYLRRLRQESRRMEQLVAGMLDLYGVAHSEPRPERVDLSDLSRSIAAELREREPQRQVEFAITPGLVVQADGRLLRIMLGNLLGNAWKFTGKHPRALIEFGFIRQDGKPIYFVRDDGAGFDMAYVERLFAPFQRLHSETEFPGTGIGLETVARIVRRHGGRIWAEGKVEEGATFYFTLP